MKGDWQADKVVAKAMLSDRGMRRKALAFILIIDLILLSTGLWVIDGWLGEGMVRFLLWWSAIGLVTIWLLLFAIYDALISIQEVKNKR